MISYGDWKFLHPETREPITSERAMDDLLNDVHNKHNGNGNDFRMVSIRLYNVYEQWDSKPKTTDQIIRYSEPHWKYFCRRFE